MMFERLNSLRINQKLAGAFGLTLLTIFTANAVSYHQLGILREARQTTARMSEILEAIKASELAMVEQSSAVRGLLLSHEAGFAEQYASQKAAYETAVKTADGLIRNREVKGLLAATVDAASAWGQQVGDIEARALVDRNAMADAMEIVRKGTSNKLLGAYRTANAVLVDAERKLMSDVKAQEAEVADMMVRVMLGGGITSIVVALLFCWLLARAVAHPITRLTGTMQNLSTGDLEAEVSDVGRGDEVGAMARAVQVFKDNALRTRELEAEASEASDHAGRERARNEAERAAVAEKQPPS